jgi:type IV pilus assembly protein PilO
MRNFSLQKKLILAGLALLFAADLALAYFTVRLSGSREQRQQALNMEALRLKEVKADVDRATRIQKGTPQVLKRLDEFEGSLLPSTKGYSVVTRELDQFAKETHLAMDDVKFHEKEKTERNLTELGLEIAINGEYSGIVQFLNKLQRSKSVYIVDALEVEPQNTGQGPVGGLKVSLHLRTYFRKV